MIACIGEPVSWLRLERFASAGGDAAIAAHVASCAACRQCLDEIRNDVVALPVLAVPERRAARRWWLWAVPAFAAAAIAILILRPRDPQAANVATIKGVGEVVVDVVRDRDGAVRDDVRSFAAGDRWKVVVTCPPSSGAWIDVAVVEVGAVTADYPLAPAHVTCGNRVVVPGAFTVTGGKPNRVCVRVAATAAPSRELPKPHDDDVACVTLRPE